jgi:hypothetical protein
MSAAAIEVSLLALLLSAFFLNAWLLIQKARHPFTSDEPSSPHS